MEKIQGLVWKYIAELCTSFSWIPTKVELLCIEFTPDAQQIPLKLQNDSSEQRTFMNALVANLGPHGCMYPNPSSKWEMGVGVTYRSEAWPCKVALHCRLAVRQKVHKSPPNSYANFGPRINKARAVSILCKLWFHSWLLQASSTSWISIMSIMYHTWKCININESSKRNQKRQHAIKIVSLIPYPMTSKRSYWYGSINVFCMNTRF